MRHPGRSSTPPNRRLVGVATEAVTSYGRSILSGVIQYANLQRSWILYKDLWRQAPMVAHWPECEGTIIGGVPTDVYLDVKSHSRLLVTCSGNYDPNEIPTVALDDAAACTMAAEHLIERGLKQFAFYGSWDLPDEARPKYTFVRRARGFFRALQKRGFECRTCDIDPLNFIDFLTQSHHPSLIRWLQSLPYPIGIMAVDDSHANDLAEACRKSNIAVPDQVAIIGVNNDELLCESAWPPLSSIECNFTRMGYLAAKLLDRLMNGEKLAPEERLIELPPVRVQQRMSTNLLAVDQADVAEAVRYIREHACDPCSVSDVLRAVPVSRRTLERQFVDRLGRTLHDEIVRVRIEVARRLLLQPDLPIDEIAGRCGFSTVQSFNRFFHKNSSMTPAAFRRQTRQDEQPGATQLFQ